MSNMRFCWLLVVLAVPARGAEPPGKLLHESWETVHAEGARVGYTHLTEREKERDGHKVRLAEKTLVLTMKISGKPVTLRTGWGTEESGEGDVTGVFMTQATDGHVKLTLKGTVQGDQLHVTVEGYTHLEKWVPWKGQVVGLSRQNSLYQQNHVKPGDRFSYLSYEPTINGCVSMTVTVKEPEEVEFQESKWRLLRAEVLPEKVPGFQLPPSTVWLDRDLLPLRSQTELPGLGLLVFDRASSEAALAPLGEVPDLFANTYVHLTRTIDRPRETRSATYRVTYKGAEDVSTLFAIDARQKVISKGPDHLFELDITAVPKPKLVAGDRKPGPEFLESSPFIPSTDPKVKEHAHKAVGDETDPWKKALLVERWVCKNMQMTQPKGELTPTDQVARTLKGNVMEYALLATALCRAAGVPARTALGLVYDEVDGGPVMRSHLWTEVWVKGQWQPIDATVGKGYVGADHLKIADHSWHDTRSLTPLLPFTRVVGKLAIEVVEVKGPE